MNVIDFVGLTIPDRQVSGHVSEGVSTLGYLRLEDELKFFVLPYIGLRLNEKKKNI